MTTEIHCESGSAAGNESFAQLAAVAHDIVYAHGYAPRTPEGNPVTLQNGSVLLGRAMLRPTASYDRAAIEAVSGSGHVNSMINALRGRDPQLGRVIVEAYCDSGRRVDAPTLYGITLGNVSFPYFDVLEARTQVLVGTAQAARRVFKQTGSWRQVNEDELLPHRADDLAAELRLGMQTGNDPARPALLETVNNHRKERVPDLSVSKAGLNELFFYPQISPILWRPLAPAA